MSQFSIGIDIGSVTAKAVIIGESTTEPFAKYSGNDTLLKLPAGRTVLFSPVFGVKGDPLSALDKIRKWIASLPFSSSATLNFTGSQAKKIAEKFTVPYINEFKAIAHGALAMDPKVRTVLEIGGDASRYLLVFRRPDGTAAILDYERNGECAAGTGSFIDQQALRLNYDIDEIGDLVAASDSSANIAGRCSVFAKSDMIHAQQRGYSPGEIFKGLCNAVVNNFKGTVLRQKEIAKPVFFIGGVAANKGVIESLRQTLSLSSDELYVPQYHTHIGALGSAITGTGVPFSKLSDSADLKSRVPVVDRTLCLDNVVFASSPVSHGQSDLQHAYLGLDVGSVSTNLVLLSPDGLIIDEVYTRTEGRPVQVVQREFAEWMKKWGGTLDILRVGTTGSGRELIGELVGADVVHDEITAHKTGADFIARTLYDSKVDTIFEIGGQDSKFISCENGIVTDFTMNEACAAGTGSFLEEQAQKMDISIKDEFADLALSSKHPVMMGERCTVFMEKDVTFFLKQGTRKADIAAGLSYAVVQNYLNRVVRGRKIGDHIYFQGGTAYNKAVAAAFSTVLNKKIIVPPHNGVMGAIGAALLAKEKMANSSPSRFRGFDLSKVRFSIRLIHCKACNNRCEVQEITIDNEKTYWGDKCSERFRKKIKSGSQTVIPNLIEWYHKELQHRTFATNGQKARIAMPKSMYYWDRFPFWQAYFGALGIELNTCSESNNDLVAAGRALCVSEPCFPIIMAHGHVASLLKSFDYVFLPNTINSEAPDPDTFSWFCPWGQTLPLMLKNEIPDHKDRILAPVIRFRDGIKSVQTSLRAMARTLGYSSRQNDQAVREASKVYDQFRENIAVKGNETLALLRLHDAKGVVLVGRPYNIYDGGLNLNVPTKLIQQYGVNVIPMDFIPYSDVDISDLHENMFWGYGYKILQASRFVGTNPNLHVIYFTNFKCGPDSYIKHFVRNAIGSPFLTLQFDDHSNDAGIMTRCEAYLQSKGLLEQTPNLINAEHDIPVCEPGNDINEL